MERQANLQRKQPCQRHMKVCGMPGEKLVRPVRAAAAGWASR